MTLSALAWLLSLDLGALSVVDIGDGNATFVLKGDSFFAKCISRYNIFIVSCRFCKWYISEPDYFSYAESSVGAFVY